MKFLFNIIWAVFYGFWAAVAFFVVGLLLHITVIGIPLGRQCFKMSKLILFPFGKEVDINPMKHPIANILWAVILGWELFLMNLVACLIFAITIVGLPIAFQCFKCAKLTFLPFGAKVK